MTKLLTTEQYYKLKATMLILNDKIVKYCRLPATQKIRMFFLAKIYNIKQLFNKNAE